MYQDGHEVLFRTGGEKNPMINQSLNKFIIDSLKEVVTKNNALKIFFHE